jgi:hypothetical protein
MNQSAPSVIAMAPTKVITPRKSYLIAAIAANMLICGIAGYLWHIAPRVYTSQWSVLLLNAGVEGDLAESGKPDVPTPTARPSVNLDDIRSRYGLIATTPEVRKAAAAKIGMTSERFGMPQVSSIGSTLMTFEVSGSTPEEAHSKARALHETLQERLNQLRVRHAAEQAAGIEDLLSPARTKLEAAQGRLAEYKLKSGEVSRDQVDQMAAEIAGLKQLRAETLAQQQDTNRWAKQLSAELLDTATQSDRDQSYQDFMQNSTERQELVARMRDLDRQLVLLQQRLSDTSQQRSRLEALQRDRQVAEAVFSSTIASLNTHKLDGFGAYPPVQIVAEPSLSQTATIPSQASLLFWATFTSLLTTTGLLLDWLRKRPLVHHWLFNTGNSDR